MSEKHTDPQIMEHNIRGVIDYWTTITQDDLTNFFNALRADAWDHAIEHVSQLEADVGFMDHYKPHNPYRKQEEA